MDEAQAAVDAWVAHYNAERPHQALDAKAPVTPADRFAPVPAAQRSLVELWLPSALEAAGAPAAETAEPDAEGAGVPPGAPPGGGPVEFDRVVPPSGNLQVAGKQGAGSQAGRPKASPIAGKHTNRRPCQSG